MRGKFRPDEVAILPTNAGILTFGKDPQSLVMQSEVICVYHKDNLGLTRWHDRKILRGSIKTLIDDAYEFVTRYVPVSARVEGLHRVETPAYPLEVLREAIVNAVVHRDYSLTGEFIRIFFHPLRIEIRNPGKLLPGLSLEQLSAGRAPSKLRNHIIVSLLREMPGGYIEHIGSGVRYMLARMEQAGLPPPTFEQTGEFVLTLYGPKETSITRIIDISPQEVELPAALTKSQRAQQTRFEQALLYLRRHGRITNLQYRTLTGTSERTALRDLEKMVETGSIRAVGETSGRYYTLP
jgi:ATP-dependent DNA helicase RecG